MAKTQDIVVQALANFEKKLDTLDSRLDSVDKTLVKQEANLGEHMRRTELAEANIADIKEDLEPVKKHVAYMEGALKGLGILAVVVSLITGLMKIIPHL